MKEAEEGWLVCKHCGKWQLSTERKECSRCDVYVITRRQYEQDMGIDPKVSFGMAIISNYVGDPITLEGKERMRMLGYKID